CWSLNSCWKMTIRTTVISLKSWKLRSNACELDEVNYQRRSLVQLEIRQPIINFYTMLLHAGVMRPVEDGNINGVDMDFEQDQQSSSPAFCNLRNPSDNRHDDLQKGRKTGKSQTKSTLSHNPLPAKGLPWPQQIKTNPKCIITTSTSINTQGLRLETRDSSSCNLERGKKKTVFNMKPTQTYRFPTIALSNFRSLNNKTEDMEVFLRKRDIDVMCLTETWILSSALAIVDGYSCYISPRCSASGEHMTHGGGVGFYCKETIPHTILDVAVPKTHDIEDSGLWARPKGLPRQVSSLIYAAVYFPPRGPYRRQLVEYLQQSCDLIRNTGIISLQHLDSNFDAFNVPILAENQTAEFKGKTSKPAFN
ncbi:hypothetical protein QYM36_018754, partial [Artemia franciscana]